MPLLYCVEDSKSSRTINTHSFIIVKLGYHGDGIRDLWHHCINIVAAAILKLAYSMGGNVQRILLQNEPMFTLR